MCVYALRIRKVIDLPLLEEEGSYVPDMDAGIEVELVDDYNCTICTYWICYNCHDYWR